MDAVVMEVFESARKTVALEAKKIQDTKSSCRCKRKVCFAAWDIGPGYGKQGFYFLFIWPDVVATFALKHFIPRW